MDELLPTLRGSASSSVKIYIYFFGAAANAECTYNMKISLVCKKEIK